MAFDTSILDAALAPCRIDYEQQRQKLLAKALRLLDELGPGYGIRQAYVFGSLISPDRFSPHLDVDIAVE